jgi:hypothetical protein
VVPIGLPASRRGRGCSGAARAQGGGGETAHRSSLSALSCACWTSIGSFQRAWRGARGSRGGLGECRGGGGVRRTRALSGGRCAVEACECSARGFCNCTMRVVRVARLLSFLRGACSRFGLSGRGTSEAVAFSATCASSSIACGGCFNVKFGCIGPIDMGRRGTYCTVLHQSGHAVAVTGLLSCRRRAVRVLAAD